MVQRHSSAAHSVQNKAGEKMTHDLSVKEERIKQLQKMLRYLSFALDEPSYKTNVTGTYDTTTELAVKSFQAKNNLPVTGEVELTTWNAIVASYNYEVSLREKVLIDPIGASSNYVTPQGEVSDTVLLLQILLRALQIRYDYNDVPLSGIYDRRTAEAVRVIQEAAELPITGNADRMTWQHIAREYNNLTDE